jgi:hypothetical protein
MAADIEALCRIYRRLATINATAPKALADQKTYLETLFVTRAGKADGGGLQAASTSFEGGAFSAVYKGSSDEERALALDMALTQIQAEIDAAADDEVTPAPTAALLPRIICAPR